MGDINHSSIVTDLDIGSTHGSYNSERDAFRKCEAEIHKAQENAATFRMMRNIMSGLQVHVPVLSTVNNALCQNQSQVFLERLQAFDMWALKSKHLTGILGFGTVLSCRWIPTFRGHILSSIG
jgi:hypothetical protein